MEYLVVDFNEQGRVQSLHTDKFDLGFLGPQKIHRQTDIEFCETTQAWDVKYITPLDGRVVAAEGFLDYESARMYEIDWLNDCRLAGCDPLSMKGLTKAHTWGEWYASRRKRT